MLADSGTPQYVVNALTALFTLQVHKHAEQFENCRSPPPFTLRRRTATGCRCPQVPA